MLGSLTIEINHKITIIGVLSSGTDNSCKGSVTGFTRVSNKVQWISENSDVSVKGCNHEERHRQRYN